MCCYVLLCVSVWPLFLELEVVRSQSNCSSLSSRDFASAWVTTVHMATDGAGIAHTTAVVPPAILPSTNSSDLRDSHRWSWSWLGIRTPGSPAQLRPCALCHVHKDILDKHDINKLMKEFVLRKDNRRSVSGKIF